MGAENPPLGRGSRPALDRPTPSSSELPGCGRDRDSDSASRRQRCEVPAKATGSPQAPYPDSPGHRNVSTSIEAADAIAPSLGRLQRLALAAIKARGLNGLTADELAETVGLDRYSIQPRTSELRRKYLIVDSGKRRLNASRKRAIVWVAHEHRPVEL